MIRSFVFAALLVPVFTDIAPALDGQLELSAVDRDTGKPLAVRVHLRSAATNKPVKVPGVSTLGDHFVFFDKVRLKLPLGSYKFTMERGPEYLIRTGHFTLNQYADDKKTVDMKRFVDMASEGWYGGDLDVRRSEKEIELLMQAEDLYVAPLIHAPQGKPTNAKSPARANNIKQFDGQRFFTFAASENSSGGNSFQTFNDDWVTATQPFAWDLPLWIATGELDGVQIANRHLMRDGVINHEADGRSREMAMYPGINGNGRWSLAIYYHLLNCGMRLPPTAGSGSGSTVSTTAARGTAAAIKAAANGNFNPVGYNRVYVFVDGELTWEKWWEGLRAGRAMVTNGPLIRPSVEGHAPGHVFRADRGQTVELKIGLTLSTRDKVSYLEVIKDGATEHEVRLAAWKETGGKLPLLRFNQSGWFLIRAVTEEATTYRYATTAPYYVEIGDEPRISRESAQFFVDWCHERTRQLFDTKHPAGKFANQKQRDERLGHWRQAEEYWTSLLTRANAP
jgi:hypothetical protein